MTFHDKMNEVLSAKIINLANIDKKNPDEGSYTSIGIAISE